MWQSFCSFEMFFVISILIDKEDSFSRLFSSFPVFYSRFGLLQTSSSCWKINWIKIRDKYRRTCHNNIIDHLKKLITNRFVRILSNIITALWFFPSLYLKCYAIFFFYYSIQCNGDLHRTRSEYQILWNHIWLFWYASMILSC